MNKIKTLTKTTPWIGYKANELIWTIGITVAIVISPAILAHTPANQIVTGTIVNALLFLAAYRMPLANSFIIAALPSSIALLRGLLPAPMAILIPYIIFSNIILISIFSTLKKTPIVGILISSITKFSLLYLVTYTMSSQLNVKIISMFQWPQLITALIGGFMFISAIKILENKKL